MDIAAPYYMIFLVRWSLHGGNISPNYMHTALIWHIRPWSYGGHGRIKVMLNIVLEQNKRSYEQRGLMIKGGLMSRLISCGIKWSYSYG